MEKPDALYDAASSESWLRFSISRAELRDFRLSAPRLIADLPKTNDGYVEVQSTDKGFRTFQSAAPRKFARRTGPFEALENDILALNT
jgi:hypothetical protein